MRVLVADDSFLMRQIFVTALQDWGYEVTEAEDGKQAWGFFQREQFPLVLTDWMMPESDGVELTRQIRAVDLPGYVYIILLTAKSEKKDLVAAMDAGADDFLVKPVDQDELRVRVRAGERIIQLERKLAERNRRLRETQSALVQSEKLASLGQLAAGMAHEINNPIAYVTNNLAVLKRDIDSVVELLETYRESRAALQTIAPEVVKRADDLEQEVDWEWVKENLPRLLESSLNGLGRVRDIIKNLREFARVDRSEKDQIDLNASLVGTIQILQHEIDEKQIVIEKSLGTIPPVSCYPAKINQVWHNLLLNAIQASSPKSTIGIRTSADSQTVTVEFEDQGTGIEQQNLERIFDPFFTTKPIGSGTGLGLAIVYGVIRDHHGTIDVSSEPLKGSTFRVRLPQGMAGS